MMKGSSNDVRLGMLLNSYGIPPKFHSATFDEFKNDDAAKEKVVKYLDNSEVARKKGYGLFLHGKNGVGKTHLMMCLLKGLTEKKYPVRSITLGTLIKVYTDYHWRGEVGWQEIVMHPTFLEVEEIGKEYKSGENDLGRTVLDTVVRLRLQMKKPILFTTNKEPKEIEAVYTHDIASMLFECTVPIKVTGVDWREKHKYAEMRGDLNL